jgi:hypothetical protein
VDAFVSCEERDEEGNGGNGMKHLLIDFDSKIPNLALMKISAWAKLKGDDVYLNDDSIEPDVIWLSCIFTWNASKAKSALALYRFRFPNAVIHYGGTGFDFFLPYGSPEWKKLPDEIEKTMPDYDLYEDDRIVGFCQRGCDRKCQFCVVWRKEGRISENEFHRLTEWVPPDRKKVLLLDNDIALADRKKHDLVLGDARDMGLKLSITQGYDIRKVFREPDRAQQLADYKPWSFTFRERMLYIAWDLPQYETMVRRGIEYLLDAGFRSKEITCYVLVGFNTKFDQDVYRVNDVLRNEYHVLAYVMPYNNRRDSQEINNLRRWANKRQLYASMDFRDYNMHFRSKAMGVMK